MTERIDISICGTVYNNVRTVKRSILSVVKALEGLNYEIVIVDNYSDDGTYEVLLDLQKELSEKGIRMKVVRREPPSMVRLFDMHCRGKGRQLAYKLSRGQYILCVDLDTIYYPEKLRQFITSYFRSSLRERKAVFTQLVPCIIPRYLLRTLGGWASLLAYENAELISRLALFDAVAFLPVNLGIEEEVHGDREKRYAKSTIVYLLRVFRRRLDNEYSSGYTLKQLITLRYYLYRRKLGVIGSLGSILLIMFFKVINLVRGLRRYPFNQKLKGLPPYLYASYVSLKNIINPLDWGFRYEDIEAIRLNLKHLALIAYYYPDVINVIKRLHREFKDKMIITY